MTFLERAVECRLICKSTLSGDVGEGKARIPHQVFGSFHTAFNQPVVRWSAKRRFEGSGKVAHRYLACICDLIEGNALLKVRIQ